MRNKTMLLEEKEISRLVITSFFERLKNSLSCDVAVVGGGPSGLVCSYLLAKQGVKTVLFERNLSLGGGIWGGAMMFNNVVFQDTVVRLLDEFKIQYEMKKGGYVVASAPQVVSSLILAACKKGVEIFNFMSAEDVVVKENKVCGIVLNWTSVQKTDLPVDPLTIESKYVVDATGHGCEISRILAEKLGHKLKLKNKMILGDTEKPMNATAGEKEVILNSKEIFPGLYVTGMAANAVYGGHRMGPIFGGVFLSGEKVARFIIKKLKY